MFTTSHEANPNYLCKLISIKNLRPHPNADRLQTTLVDYQTVITGLDAKIGDKYVYFPVESKINKEFLSATNSFRDATLNANNQTTGFFEENCRVRAMKLRGERSEGYIVPLSTVIDFVGDVEFKEDIYFDTVNGIKLVEKYIPKGTKEKTRTQKTGRKPKESRMIDGQFHFHNDTQNLRRYISELKPTDNISISYKLHGSSVILSNVMVKKKLDFFNRLLSKLGFDIRTEEYDLIYASRKVIKNSNLVDKDHNHYYDEDIWGIVAEENKDKIPKGYTVYGEIVGYLSNGNPIQEMGKAFDYGCKEGEHNLYVYRVTFTNTDGIVSELSTYQIGEFCNKYGFNMPHVYFMGTYEQFLNEIGLDSKDYTDEQVIRRMEELYNEKNCWMCTNKVPEEGVVLRIEHLSNFEAYKLKSFSFLEGESKQEEADIETEN